MTAKSAFSIVGLAHKLCLSAEEQGYTPELLNALAESPDLFRQLREVQLGHAEIRQVEHLIDCDADPFVPEGWEVEEHQKGGQFKFDAARVQFYLSESQLKGRRAIKGKELRKELSSKPVLNANVLDYLLAHPHLIPEEWKQDSEGHTRYIFFWGTIYRGSGGDLYVRCLFWFGGRWVWSFRWLEGVWFDQVPAVLLAS